MSSMSEFDDVSVISHVESKFPKYLMKKLRQRLDLDESDTSKDSIINRYSPDEAFYEILVWDGLLGSWDSRIKTYVLELYNVDLTRVNNSVRIESLHLTDLSGNNTLLVFTGQNPISRKRFLAGVTSVLRTSNLCSTWEETDTEISVLLDCSDEDKYRSSLGVISDIMGMPVLRLGR